MQYTHPFFVDYKNPVVLGYLGFDLISGDGGTDIIEVTIMDDGVSADLSTAVATLYVVREDLATVDYAMNIVDNVASVAIPVEATAILGRAIVMVRVAVTGITRTVLKRYTDVQPGITGVIVDPGSAIPSLDALLSVVASIESGEEGRVTAEEGRVTAEGLRDTAEGLRETAEGLRATAEEGRATATAQAISDCEAASAALASGLASPAGTYANLAALIAADPDHSKIYITLDDGNWCYYSTGSSAFVAGGVYQAAGGAFQEAIAPEYDPDITYALGAVRTYLGTRYKCTTAITVAEAWTVEHWTAEDVQTVLDEHGEAIDGKADNVSLGYVPETITVTAGQRPKLVTPYTTYLEVDWLTGTGYRYAKVDVTSHVGKAARVRGTTGGTVAAYPCAFAVNADGLILQKWGTDTANVIYGYETPVSGQTNAAALEITIPDTAVYLYIGGQVWTALSALPTLDVYATQALKEYVDEQDTALGAWEHAAVEGDNLLDLPDGEYTQSGITVRVSEHNRVTVTGANTSGATLDIAIGTIYLPAGTYYCKGFRTLPGNTYASNVVLAVVGQSWETPMHWYASKSITVVNTYTLALRVKIADTLNLSSFFRMSLTALGEDSEYIPPVIDYYTAKRPYANVALNPLYGKLLSFNGDSICNGGTRWPGGYPKIIAEANGAEYENLGISGGTLAYHADNYHIPTGITSMAADADYAICEGMYNDYAVDSPMGALTEDTDDVIDNTTFIGGAEELCRALIARFAGRRIGYIITHRINAAVTTANGAGHTLSAYHAALLTVLDKYGIPRCDLYNNSPLVTALAAPYGYTLDGIHPMYEGYMRYYKTPIEAWVRTL